MNFEGMAEWLNAAVLKAAKGTTFEGSNPSPFANFKVHQPV